MIDFDKAIELIRRNGGFKPNNNDSSYYRVYRVSGSKPMQVRVSNHGTHLKTWFDKDYDPSYAINTCVVYSEDGMHDSNVTVEMRKTNEQGAVIGEKKMFEVIQYVYNCQLLNDNDAALINQAILSTWQNKSFKDPFAGTPKHAKVYKLKPNEPIETLVENKIHNKKIMNKKQVIRINENQLKQIVTESVKRVLNETNNGYVVPHSWYGNYSIIENIADEARKLIKNLEHNYWEEFDKPDEYPTVVEIRKWAYKIVEDCERFCNQNVQYMRPR